MAQSAKADGISESFTKMSEAFLSFDIRKVAALYLDFVESLTQQVLEFQETSKEWAKETPLGPFMEFQTSISRKLAETSISLMRSVCQNQTQI